MRVRFILTFIQYNSNLWCMNFTKKFIFPIFALTLVDANDDGIGNWKRVDWIDNVKKKSNSFKCIEFMWISIYLSHLWACEFIFLAQYVSLSWRWKYIQNLYLCRFWSFMFREENWNNIINLMKHTHKTQSNIQWNVYQMSQMGFSVPFSIKNHEAWETFDVDDKSPYIYFDSMYIREWIENWCH